MISDPVSTIHSSINKEKFLVGSLALGHIDLALMVLESNVNLSTVHLLAVLVVEDVADRGAVSKWCLRDVNVDAVILVGKANEECATGESVEVVKNVLLLERVAPDLGVLPRLVDLGGGLVDVAGGVHVLPQGLAVLWVIATRVGLLGTVVVERNTTSSQREDMCRRKSRGVVEVVHEAGVVVVVNEEAESIDVLEVGLLIVVATTDVVHRLTASKNVLNGVVHRVVEHASQHILVGANICGITIEVLAHLEDTGGSTILGPEVLGHLRNRVNTNTVKTVGVDEVLDPVLQIATDVIV